jgi:hypothetical protein
MNTNLFKISKKYNTRGKSKIRWFVNIAFIILLTAASGSVMGRSKGNLNK